MTWSSTEIMFGSSCSWGVTSAISAPLAWAFGRWNRFLGTGDRAAGPTRRQYGDLRDPVDRRPLLGLRRLELGEVLGRVHQHLRHELRVQRGGDRGRGQVEQVLTPGPHRQGR